MPPAAKAITSKNVDTALQIYDTLMNALKTANVPDDLAKKYAGFAVDVYKYIRDRPQLQGVLSGLRATYDMGKGGAEYVLRDRLATNAVKGGFQAAGKLTKGATASASGPISAFVDYCVALAKVWGVPMNECAIAVTKVLLDVLAVLALAETVVGVWVAVVQAYAAGADTKDLIDQCFAGEAAHG